MKKLFGLISLLAFLSPLFAQPLKGASSWKVSVGNPITIEPPAGWNGPLTCAEFSPDGALLAVGGGTWVSNEKANHGVALIGDGVTWDTATITRQGVILLFDGHTGAPVGELHGHDEYLRSIMFSPDGKLLASQTAGGEVFLWDVATGKLLHRLSEGHNTPDWESGKYPPRLNLGAWSPDSKTLANYETKIVFVKLSDTLFRQKWTSTLQYFDSESGKIIRAFGPYGGAVNQMKWTSDGKNMLVTPVLLALSDQPFQLSSSAAISIFDAQNGEFVRVLGQSYTSSYRAMIFDPLAQFALIASVADFGQPKLEVAIAELWDLKEKRVIWTQPFSSSEVQHAIFSHDGQTFITSTSDSEIVFRDTTTGAIRKTLPVNEWNNSVRALSADATRLATLKLNPRAIQLWKLD